MYSFCSIEPTEEEIAKYSSKWGNRWVEITDEDIEDLRNGKILRYSDGEYATFVVLKEKENE